MAALMGTVILTGANGTLGSRIAQSIAKEQPLIHLLFTARDLSSQSVADISNRIRSIGPRSFEIAKLDLASFVSVRDFARHTLSRVRGREIPPIAILINCAGVSSFTKDPLTEDGFDLVYQTNCLSPFLLTVSLLEAFRNQGSDISATKVINLGSVAMARGTLDYFSDNVTGTISKTVVNIGLKEGIAKYGSSKLKMNVSMYALRRSLKVSGDINIDIMTVDPGGIANETRLSSSTPAILSIARTVLSYLGPVVRIFDRSIINDVDVPGKFIARLAFRKEDQIWNAREKYFILDQEYEVGSVVRITQDKERCEEVLQDTMRAVDLDMEEISSPI